MWFAILLGILGVVLGGIAASQVVDDASQGWVILAVEVHGSISLLALAVAHGFRSAGAPVEDLTSRSGWGLLVRAALLPYSVLAASTLAFSSWLLREDMMNEIASGLFLGRLPFPWERRGLKAAGVTAVLNLCWEFPSVVTVPGVATISIPILDGCPPTRRQFRETVERVERWREEGRVVLIHCAQGHGRSAIVSAAILNGLGLARDADEALTRIRAARPRANPSPAQIAALRAFLERTAFPCPESHLDG